MIVSAQSGNTSTGSSSQGQSPGINYRYCKGFIATIIGTPANDIIVGTSGNDVVSSFEGNDIVDGLGGNDVICAGAGEDQVYGGEGFV